MAAPSCRSRKEIKLEYSLLYISQDQLEVCMKDWAELADEYRDLELRHKEYREASYVTKLRPESSK